jgi:hypothetical protein
MCPDGTIDRAKLAALADRFDAEDDEELDESDDQEYDEGDSADDSQWHPDREGAPGHYLPAPTATNIDRNTS